MVWTTLTSGQRDADSPIDQNLIDALYNNPAAIANADSGAPSIVNGALASHPWGQSDLDTTTGSVSTGGSAANLTLPGGTYGFYPQVRDSIGSNSGAEISGSATNTSFATYIYLKGSVSGTQYAQQRYFNASPPYDMGDGEIPLFVFALVNNSPRTVDGAYTADCAPWHYNGPTQIKPDVIRNGIKYRRVRRLTRALRDAADDPVLRTALIAELRDAPIDEIEITQAIKQADMPLIPHPWHTGNDLTGKTVVLLDPVSDLVARLAELHNAGENINEILHADYLRPDNTALTRAGPPGVRVVAPRWRNTG